MGYLKHIETSGPLPTSHFELWNEGVCVGRIQVRHRPSHGSEVPEACASHIYYAIEKPHRGKGYGKEILRLGLEEAGKIGLQEVVVSCEEANTASKKVIEANGGQYDGYCVRADGRKQLRYRFALLRGV